MSAKTTSAANGRIDTLIGTGMHVAGDVACTGVVRVQGAIVGSVSCDGSADGTLVVDSAGRVDGPACASHVAVRGRIDGPVRAARTMEVFDGGSVVGEVAFTGLAIHAGGVIDGTLTPMRPFVDDEPPQTVQPTMPPMPLAVTGGGNAGLGVGRKAAIAVVALIVVAVAVWQGKEHFGKRPAVDDTVLRSAKVLEDGKPQYAAPASASVATTAPAPAAAPQPATDAPLATTVAEPPPPQPERPALDPAKVATIQGANANRPANVFLLVTSEPTVLFRKRRDDAGEGARIAVPQGERVSVGIGAGELIRVAKGSNAVIFYQGKKVPAEIIESGTWISFVAR